MDIDTGFAIYTGFCVCIGIFGLWAAGKVHKH